jgi:hypothetical protein
MDVVVTVPQDRWAEWLEEGDHAGLQQPGIWTKDHEYGYCFGRGSHEPNISEGERVYVVAHRRLRGYAPLVRIDPAYLYGGVPGGFALVRRNDARAVTIPGEIRGFQNWRYRWWSREEETLFPEWREAGG